MLIKAVAHAIPTYAMSLFKFSKELCHTIRTSINRLWWGHKEGEQKIHWLNSSSLCRSKDDGGLGFRDMEAFNEALLAKQFWRLLKRDQSLVSRLFKAKYFPESDIFNATLGPRPSYTWRSIFRVREVIIRGSRWLVGDGRSLNVWQSRWIPRPRNFKVITPTPESFSTLKVCDLIDEASMSWREQQIRELFLPVDVDEILNIPLCDSKPVDKIIWHYNLHGLFTVRSAYHVIVSDRFCASGSSPEDSKKIWKLLWSMNIPPRIKRFGWRLCRGILPTSVGLSRRVTNLSMRCSICGHPEEDDIHALFECPLAESIWSCSEFERKLWACHFRSARDCVEGAMKSLNQESLGNFLAILWKCWEAQNRFIFTSSDINFALLCEQAISFVKQYREHKMVAEAKIPKHQEKWRPPPAGVYKLNFDGGRIGDSGWSWGFVLRNDVGDIILAGTKSGSGFAGPLVEEARACLFGLRCAYEWGARNIIIEGDSLGLIQLLKTRSTHDNFVGLFVNDILAYVESFDFYAWTFVKRGGNKVAHELAHLPLLGTLERLWE